MGAEKWHLKHSSTLVLKGSDVIEECLAFVLHHLLFTVIIYLFCVGDSYSVRMAVRTNLPFGNGSQCSDCPTSSLSDLFVNDLEQNVFQIISSDYVLFSHPLVPPIRVPWFAGILVYHSNLSPKVVWKQRTFSFLKCVVYMMIHGRLTEASSMLRKVFRHVSNIM